MLLRQLLFVSGLALFMHLPANGQVKVDSVHVSPLAGQHANDTMLRITNLSPYFSLHVDSSLSYHFLLNKNPKNYYWYLKDAPSGLRVDKDNGVLTFKSNKSLFLSGRLKYDHSYPVQLSVQNLNNPDERVDTTFNITFYNTDVMYPRIKPTVVSPVTVEEGSKLSFNVMCENGNFPIDKILFSSSTTISSIKMPKGCDDIFEWTPPYDFVRDTDSAGVKILTLYFVGATNFNFSDTARVRVIVKNSLNYDNAKMEYDTMVSKMNRWVKDLKYTFLQLDKKLRKTKGVRSGFDITTATTTLTGTVLATTADATTQKSQANMGKILPSIGVVAMPVKEAAAPQKTVEQNQAALVRSTIKRLEYTLFDNRLSGDKDPAITSKTETLNKEMRQSQVQLAEVPTDFAETMSEDQINRIFESRRVQKKYRLR